MRRKKNGRSKNLIQGEYQIQNWEKYAGKTNPRYLSSWELQVMKFLENHPDVVLWGSETVVVPYFNPVKERKARYMVDFYAKYKNKNGYIREEIIEVKPYAQCLPPTKTARKRQDIFESESLTYAQNTAKWQAAKKYAEDRGWSFRVITEYDIFRK